MVVAVGSGLNEDSAGKREASPVGKERGDIRDERAVPRKGHRRDGRGPLGGGAGDLDERRRPGPAKQRGYGAAVVDAAGAIPFA